MPPHTREQVIANFMAAVKAARARTEAVEAEVKAVLTELLGTEPSAQLVFYTTSRIPFFLDPYSESDDQFTYPA